MHVIGAGDVVGVAMALLVLWSRGIRAHEAFSVPPDAPRARPATDRPAL